MQAAGVFAFLGVALIASLTDAASIRRVSRKAMDCYRWVKGKRPRCNEERRCVLLPSRIDTLASRYCNNGYQRLFLLKRKFFVLSTNVRYFRLGWWPVFFFFFLRNSFKNKRTNLKRSKFKEIGGQCCFQSICLVTKKKIVSCNYNCMLWYDKKKSPWLVDVMQCKDRHDRSSIIRTWIVKWICTVFIYRCNFVNRQN